MFFSQLIINDNDEKCSIQITVISSEARNPYDVARASSISGCKGLPPFLESRTAYSVVSGISRHFVPRNDTLKESFQTMIRNALKPPAGSKPAGGFISTEPGGSAPGEETQRKPPVHLYNFAGKPYK